MTEVVPDEAKQRVRDHFAEQSSDNAAETLKRDIEAMSVFSLEQLADYREMYNELFVKWNSGEITDERGLEGLREINALIASDLRELQSNKNRELVEN